MERPADSRESEEQRQLRQSLESALEAAQEANAAKTRFLSNVSHDMRTPLTAIIGLTTIAQEHADDERRVRDCLAKIMLSSHHLLGLINDVLDMSKIESGQIVFGKTPFCLADLIDEVAAIVQPQATTKNLSFAIVDPPDVSLQVVGDPMRVSQVLINLLGNSIKYTEPGGHVTLTVGKLGAPPASRSAAEDAPGSCAFRFVIEDDGIGMSQEFIDRIFEPFERDREAQASGIEGTGLGMAITKSIVDAMGGRVEVASERGRGTRFTVMLPLERAEEEVPAAEGAAKPGAGDGLHGDAPVPGGGGIAQDADLRCNYEGARVLLAEDTPIIAEIAKDFIERTGAAIEHVTNGAEAVERMAAAPEGWFDLIFMDVQMPVMDGLEASRQIIAQAQAGGRSRPPIIAMTANAYAEDRRLAREAGMDGYAVKPVDYSTICKIFDQYLPKR